MTKNVGKNSYQKICQAEVLALNGNNFKSISNIEKSNTPFEIKSW